MDEKYYAKKARHHWGQWKKHYGIVCEDEEKAVEAIYRILTDNKSRLEHFKEDNRRLEEDYKSLLVRFERARRIIAEMELERGAKWPEQVT